MRELRWAKERPRQWPWGTVPAPMSSPPVSEEASEWPASEPALPAYPGTPSRAPGAGPREMSVLLSRFQDTTFACPVWEQRIVRIRIFKICGLSVLAPLRDENLPILINHKIPQILILTIHRSVYAGSAPFRDGNLPILINHKIPQILILTIHGSVYAGSAPFRDGNLPILINHKIPQILILTIHGSVYAGLLPFRDAYLPILINHKIPPILILTVHGSVYA